MGWRCVILGAGQGTRMKSDLAKVLHPLLGETLLSHVLSTASRLPIERTAVIVGHQRERVIEAHARWQAEFVLQEPQRGTGHAVQQAEPFLRDHDGATLILYGDVPLLRRSTLLELMEEHGQAENVATVLTARVEDPTGYGRIIRGADGALAEIVEHRDLSPDQRAIDEINSGIYAFRTGPLLEALSKLTDANDQKELYLTDTIRLIRSRGMRVGTYTLADPSEISGINTVEQLAAAERVLEERGRDGTLDCAICGMTASGRAGEYPVLLRRESAVLSVGSRPYNSGQLSVHPVRHVLRHAALGEQERRDLWDLAQIASSAIEEVCRPQGMNIGYTSGRPGEHLAMEVIPRWVGDTNFLPLLAGLTLLPEAPDRTHARIREALEARGLTE